MPQLPLTFSFQVSQVIFDGEIGARATEGVIIAATVVEMLIYYLVLVALHLQVVVTELTRLITGFASVARTTKTIALCSPSFESSYCVAARRLDHLLHPHITAPQCRLHAPRHSSAGSLNPNLHSLQDYSLLDLPHFYSSIFPQEAVGLTIVKKSTIAAILAN